MPAVAHAQRSVQEALDAFVSGDDGRSVAVESLNGESVRAYAAADTSRPGASLLKLPLVAAIYDAARGGRLDLAASVQRSELPGSAYPTVLAVFEAGHAFTLGELCGLCLLTSDNPIADHLIGLIGMDEVNDAARRLGCVATRMTVGFGDGYRDEAGYANVTTARDALAMVRGVVERYPEASQALASNVRNFRIPLRLPDETRVPHKTGSLPGVANDAGLVFGDKTDLAVAFLCERQVDTAATSIEIGDCVARIRHAVGETALGPGLPSAE
jgi:beta-lactamase class A